MKVTIWDKSTISKLTDSEKEMWFDVLNNGIEEDRDISLNDIAITHKQMQIKQEYFKYLHECTRTPYFMSYFVLYNNDNLIVSLCRVVMRDNQYYLEGLETHRDYYQKGYASHLIKEVIKYLKEMDVVTLRSSVSRTNQESLNFHKANGFAVYNEDELKIRFQYDIMGQPRYEPFFFTRLVLIPLLIGIPYHIDNNKRFYKGMYNSQVYGLLVCNFFINLLIYFAFDSQIIWVVIINISFLFLINIMNSIHLLKHKDIDYQNAVKKFFITSVIVSITFTVVTAVLTLFIR